jgi:hypothetical protein
MKAEGTDEMYRKENWKTHRKLVYGSSKCYTTDVKQQTNDGRLLQKYVYGDTVQPQPWYHYNNLLQDNSHQHYKDKLSHTLQFNTVISQQNCIHLNIILQL